MAAVFAFIRTAGEGLINWVLDPAFNHLYLPLMERLSAKLAAAPLLQHLLVGAPVGGKIDFEQSMGMLTTGLYVELAVVLPYLLAFYLALALLEDVGYLPRLGVVLDSFMHRLGLHGFSVIPILLGFGCNVPGILATRSLETRRQRFVACTLITIGIPCVSLQAMIFKLVGQHGFWPVAAVYLFLAAVTILLGVCLKWGMRGFLPELILEIPPYRRPRARLVAHKLYHNARGFLLEATPLILGGILLMNVLDYVHAFESVSRLLAPVVHDLWGLPENAILPIIMGFLRKDVAAGMLAPLHLMLPQLMTACVLLSLTFPCVATFIVLFNELGWKDTLKSIGIMILTATLFGAAAHLLFPHIV
jgi:ferrous iron transport protein B